MKIEDITYEELAKWQADQWEMYASTWSAKISCTLRLDVKVGASLYRVYWLRGNTTETIYEGPDVNLAIKHWNARR